MAPRRLAHDDVTAFEGLATDRAQEIIAALDATRHAGTEQRLGVLIKRRSSHLRHGQDTMSREDAFLEHVANRSDPIVAIDLGTSPAQRRLTAQGNEMVALTTRETAVCDIAHLLRMTPPAHLVDEVIRGGRSVTRTALFTPLPMRGKDLLEAMPADQDVGSHGSPSRWGVGVSSSHVVSRPDCQSHPAIGSSPRHRRFLTLPPTLGRSEAKKANSYTMHLAPSGRTLFISDVPDASPTASSHPQVCQC